MACNVCGCTVKKCENKKCDKSWDSKKFLCYEGGLGETYHFCDRICFDEWFFYEKCINLEDAEDDGI